jgi:hypothetical protein
MPTAVHAHQLAFFPTFLSWSVTADWCIAQSGGPSAHDYDIGSIVGRDVREVIDAVEGADALAMIARGLAGESLSVHSHVWGRTWWNLITPQFDATGSVARIDAVSVPLPEETVEVATVAPLPEMEPDGIHAWMVRAAMRTGGAHLQPGQVVRYDGRRCVLVAPLDTDDTLCAIRRHGERFDYLLPHDPSPPAPPAGGWRSRGAPEPPPAALRLVQ